ncbi:MAG: hypothetical protein AB7N71_02460 [Phycisphaerae bacterium]
MGRRSEKFDALAAGRIEETDARESIERRWHKFSLEDESLARMVTAVDTAHEPFHRWMPYTQGFSPQLVRHFLDTAHPLDLNTATGLLDPFSGSGTFVLECARRNVHATGVDVIAALAFLTNAAATASFPPLPDMRKCRSWQDAAAMLEEPIHRAALMLAVARMHSGKGDRLRDAPPLPTLFNNVVRMIREDLVNPLAAAPCLMAGDARRLTDIPDNSVGGILTSPPYLSRHNYGKITRPLRRVYQTWHPPSESAPADQIAADVHTDAHADIMATHPAVVESCAALQRRNLASTAAVVTKYFADMRAVLKACQRVLTPGAPCWMVVGGARVREIYVPADLILGDIAKDCGFEVRQLVIARRLITAGRKLGNLSDIAPRESILELHKKC